MNTLYWWCNRFSSALRSTDSFSSMVASIPSSHTIRSAVVWWNSSHCMIASCNSFCQSAALLHTWSQRRFMLLSSSRSAWVWRLSGRRNCWLHRLMERAMALRAFRPSMNSWITRIIKFVIKKYNPVHKSDLETVMPKMRKLHGIETCAVLFNFLWHKTRKKNRGNQGMTQGSWWQAVHTAVLWNLTLKSNQSEKHNRPLAYDVRSSTCALNEVSEWPLTVW